MFKAASTYSVGDINGDGTGDLAYIATNYYGPNYAPGIFIAMGKGDGSFELLRSCPRLPSLRHRISTSIRP